MLKTLKVFDNTFSGKLIDIAACNTVTVSKYGRHPELLHAMYMWTIVADRKMYNMLAKLAREASIIQPPESTIAARTRIMTGLLPPIDDNANPTCLNALLQAMNQVRNVEFVFVHDPALGKTPVQETMEPTGVKAIPFDTGAQSAVTAAVESVQIVIKLK